MSYLSLLAEQIEEHPLGSRVRTELEELLDVAVAQKEWKQKKTITWEELINQKPPGHSFQYNKGLPRKTNQRLRKAQIRQDLATDYHYGNAALQLRRKLIHKLSKCNRIYHGFFGMYGREARLQATFEDGTVAVVTYFTLKRMEALVERLINGYKYAIPGSFCRSPFTGVAIGPHSLTGIYRPAILTTAAAQWLQKEPALQSFRDYLSKQLQSGSYKDTFAAVGILSPHTLEILLRQTLMPTKPIRINGRNTARYLWPPLLRELLQPTEQYLVSTQVKRIVYQLLRKGMRSDIGPPYDPLNIEHRDFVDEMMCITTFADEQAEERARKVDTKKQPQLVRQRKRELEYESVD
jgi:hypothetical protein